MNVQSETFQADKTGSRFDRVGTWLIIAEAESFLQVLLECDFKVHQFWAPMNDDGHQGRKQPQSWVRETHIQALELFIQNAVHDYKSVLDVLLFLKIFLLYNGWMIVINFVKFISTSFPVRKRMYVKSDCDKLKMW